MQVFVIINHYYRPQNQHNIISVCTSLYFGTFVQLPQKLIYILELHLLHLPQVLHRRGSLHHLHFPQVHFLVDGILLALAVLGMGHGFKLNPKVG
jgi:hypothetical protein